MITIRHKVTIIKKGKAKKIMRFGRYNGMVISRIITTWCYYQKSEFFENFTRKLYFIKFTNKPTREFFLLLFEMLTNNFSKKTHELFTLLSTYRLKINNSSKSLFDPEKD